MDPLAVRVALGAPESRACLTERQNEALGAFLRCNSVAGVAKAMGVSRQTAMKHLRLATKKLLAFGRAALQ